ncbi:type VI secretion protein IcmF [Salmonella enterica subsp. arizonae]|uniref:Type VI secretion protein IcmF n=1 Tax=Salmonella enterica subsp. arizonae TaxID=59203 RepID=A0A2X4TYN5_SALER|nr:type VI secretion protein IcmF [Salmonella enterica subsp. arizonae]
MSVEINQQQRYLDLWLLRLQRHLDRRNYLYHLPWYMVIGPKQSGKSTLLREGYPADDIWTPEKLRGEPTARGVLRRKWEKQPLFSTLTVY